MPVYLFQWNDEIERHLAEHGVVIGEFEEVVCNPDFVGVSRSTGRPIAFGETSSCKYLACVYELVDDLVVIPMTAFEPEED